MMIGYFDRFDFIESQYYCLNKYPKLFSSYTHKRFNDFCERRKFKPGLNIMSPGIDREGMRFCASQILRSVRNQRQKVMNYGD